MWALFKQVVMGFGQARKAPPPVTQSYSQWCLAQIGQVKYHEIPRAERIEGFYSLCNVCDDFSRLSSVSWREAR